MGSTTKRRIEGSTASHPVQVLSVSDTPWKLPITKNGAAEDACRRRGRTYLVQSVDDAIHKMAGVLGEQVVDHLMNEEQSWYTRQQRSVAGAVDVAHLVGRSSNKSLDDGADLCRQNAFALLHKALQTRR